MKHILTLLLASASLSYGAANDLLIAQRNSTDTGQLTRLVAHPGGSNNGLVAFNGATLLPVCIQIGDGLVWSTGQLSAIATQAVLDAKQDLIVASDSSKYYRGDKTWATFPSIPAGQVQTDWNAVSGMGVLLNKPILATVATSGVYSDLTGRPTLATVATSGDYGDLLNKPTLGTAAAQNSTAFATAAQGVKADTALQPGWTGQNTITTVGTISAGTWQGTAIANTYIASASTWNAKEPAISSGSNTQYWRGDKTWQTLATVGSTGSYTDLVNTPSAPSITNNPSRTIQTVAAAANGWQVSSTKTSFVSYSVTITVNASGLLAGAGTGYLVLETSTTNSASAGNWIEIARASNGQQITSLLTLASVQPVGSTLVGYIAPGSYLRLRSVNVQGTPSYAINSSQEVIIS